MTNYVTFEASKSPLKRTTKNIQIDRFPLFLFHRDGCTSDHHVDVFYSSRFVTLSIINLMNKDLSAQ